MTNGNKRTSLATYVKANCARWSLHGGCWQTEKIEWLSKNNIKTSLGSCRVADGQPCDYFRKSVLGARDCPYSVREAYFRIDRGACVKQTRLCPECGSELGYKQRICDKCRKKHARERTHRHRQREQQTCNAYSVF